MVESYLTNKTQRVFFNGSLSLSGHVSSSILQGSSLGPMLFSIFTNDLPFACTKARMVMYAHDSTLYMSASTVEEITSVLNKELQFVFDWITENYYITFMFINISKTKSILFGSTYSLSSSPKMDLILWLLSKCRRLNSLV